MLFQCEFVEMYKFDEKSTKMYFGDLKMQNIHIQT